jgi:hypothetical protein
MRRGLLAAPTPRGGWAPGWPRLLVVLPMLLRLLHRIRTKRDCPDAEDIFLNARGGRWDWFVVPVEGG